MHDYSLNEKIKLSLGEPLIPTARIEALLPISYMVLRAGCLFGTHIDGPS